MAAPMKRATGLASFIQSRSAPKEKEQIISINDKYFTENELVGMTASFTNNEGSILEGEIVDIVGYHPLGKQARILVISNDVQLKGVHTVKFAQIISVYRKKKILKIKLK